ncbi:hypothetical protein SAMN05216311_1199 [Chitinophaga sp. CF418]|nr:hypothetical protein SAMN05216311_1199 [Chitinophaga sp. CF418]
MSEYPDKIVNYEFMRGLIPEYSDLRGREGGCKKIAGNKSRYLLFY